MVGKKIQLALRPVLILLLLFLPVLSAQVQPSRSLQTWRREPTGVEADPGCDDRPQAMGSLQKPFVAKAWALAHPFEPSPRLRCPAGPGCWLPAGHGELGLADALTHSCNAYFIQLAAATPPDMLAATLAEAGFSGRAELTPELAIGLGGVAGLTIRPSSLLEAYRRLVRAPWPAGEPIRQEVLAGLRQAALTGTAAGLGQRGYWAKTGTVRSDPLHTRGWAVAVDDAGWAILARLDPATGAEAAAALAGPLKRLRPWAASTQPRPERRGLETGTVTIRMFDLLRPEQLVIRNLGPAPIPMGHGFLGPGMSGELHPGEQTGPGLLEVSAAGQGLLRRLEGSLRYDPGLRLRATVTVREYAGGILEAELPRVSPLRLALGAAVLRFLAQPRRHPDADVCDSTHCAWFVGRGPRLDWADPEHALARPETGAGPWGFTDAEWTEVCAAASQPGPSLWTSHCGGRPLAPQALWGQGSTRAESCLRHGPGRTRPWVREWSAADLAKAFETPVTQLDVTHDRGVWGLRVAGPQGPRTFSYDDAHRRLAKVLGWGALPSPADEVAPGPSGWRAAGAGQGHRVGLCLGD